MDCPNCPMCGGHGCPRCDFTGVLGGDAKLPIAPYPAPYDAQQQLMTDWTLAYPVERPEMLIWGSSLVVAAFMFAAPQVVAGFGGLFGVSDETYMKAEEEFQNAAYQFDHAVDCGQQRRLLRRMDRAWKKSGRDRHIGKQYMMRYQQHKNEC